MTSSRGRGAFFAYPSTPRDLTEPIEAAAAVANSTGDAPLVDTWPQVHAFGADIPDEIRRKITASDVLVGDVTIPNQNVYYELGFAIGAGKAIAPVVNTAFAGATQNLQSDGIEALTLLSSRGFRPYGR